MCFDGTPEFCDHPDFFVHLGPVVLSYQERGSLLPLCDPAKLLEMEQHCSGEPGTTVGLAKAPQDLSVHPQPLTRRKAFK